MEPAVISTFLHIVNFKREKSIPVAPEKRLSLPFPIGNPQPRVAKGPQIQRPLRRSLEQLLDLARARGPHDLLHLLGRKQLLQFSIPGTVTAKNAPEPNGHLRQRFRYTLRLGQVRVRRRPEEVEEVVQRRDEGFGGTGAFDVMQAA